VLLAGRAEALADPPRPPRRDLATTASSEEPNVTIVHHTPEDMKAWRDSWAEDPGIAKLYELTRRHAIEQGGLTLAVWKLHMGQIFGEPIMMTADDVAGRLELPVSAVVKIIDDTNAQVVPQWKETPEYRASRYAKGGS
jgi:hypothetical protein